MSPGVQAELPTDAANTPTSGRRGRTVRFGFVPALDGVRAVAVLGVMLYHGGAPFAGGGYLGIDVFFVLSGFLITTLLIGEWGERMTIKLGQFWARRARRLLPALLVLLVGVALYTKVFASPGEFANLRLDALSTLFYVSNWHFISAGSDYFNLTAQPSPLQHMWSLSIEEQFYIVWPPVALLLLRVGRRLRPDRRFWPILSVAVLGALASAIDMRWTYQGGASITRLYEGTDTRCQDILVGAALAIGMAIWAERRSDAVGRTVTDGVERAHPSAGTTGVAPPGRYRRDRHRRRGPSVRPIAAWEIGPPGTRFALQLVGWSACGVALYLGSRLTGWSPFLFEGGYLLFALGVAAVIFCLVTAQRAQLARAFGNPVFRYIGKISYGVYLWHFPLFAFVSAERFHLYGYPLLVVRISATLLVATGSFYLVEEPVRRGRLRSLTEWRAWLATSGAFVSVVAVTLAATVPTTANAASTARLVGDQYSGPPVKVLLFGDSVAWRIGFSMLASQPQLTYNVNLDNGAIVGCGVVRSTAYRDHGIVSPTASQCNTDTPKSAQWPAQWQGDLARFRPNVVVVLAGRWEVSDRLIGGRWQHLGQPAYDTDLRQSLEQAVQVGSSTGALVLLMTSPCFDSGEQPNGQPWPEDAPARIAQYNAIVGQVAADHPTTVAVDDFGSQLCPNGAFTPTIGGVQVRDGDGVHVPPTPAAGQWLAARILPEAIKVGRLDLAGGRFALPGSTSSTLSPSRQPVLSAEGGNNLRGS